MAEDQQGQSKVSGIETGVVIRQLRRYGVGTLVVLILVGTTFGPVTAAGATTTQTTYVFISDVSVSDESPETGDRVTFDVTVQVSGESDGGFEMSWLSLRTQSGESLAYAEDFGTLGPGNSLTVELSTTFETAGPKTVIVEGGGLYTNEAAGRTLNNRVLLDVEEPSVEETTQPGITIETGHPVGDNERNRIIMNEQPVAQTQTNFSVLVSNPNDDPLENVELVLDSNNTAIEPKRYTEAEIGGMNDSSYVLSTVVHEPGPTELVARLQHADGKTEMTKTIDVEPLDPEVSMFTEIKNGKLHTSVVNLGNVRLDNFAIEGYGHSEPVGFGKIEPGEHKNATLDMGSVENFMISARYEAGVNDQVVHTNVSAAPDSGSESNTGTQSTPSDDTGTTTATETSAQSNGMSPAPLASSLGAGLIGGVGITYFVLSGRRD